MVTPLNRYIGYEEAAKVAKQALAERKTIRQVVIERGYVAAGKISEQDLDRALDVLAMTRPPQCRPLLSPRSRTGGLVLRAGGGRQGRSRVAVDAEPP